MNNIRELRTRCGYSQSLLAQKVGVSQQAVSAWESGRSEPRLNQLPKLTAILGCKMEELFCLNDQKENPA